VKKPKRLPKGPALSAKITVSDVRQRWSAFDEAELRAIRNSADLVMQVQAKYGLDKNQAQTNVDVWAKGRNF
jgi:hypothetical protein